MKENQSLPKLLVWTFLGMVLISGFLFLRIYSLQHPASVLATTPALPKSINLWAIFLTGLVTGGLTCLAVQGGLLAATIAQREEDRLKEQAKHGAAMPIASFLIAKLVAYTILGLLLGLLGSVVQLSLTATVVMQFAVAIFMVGTALHILNVRPIVHYFIIQPPKFLLRLVRKQSKSKSIFAPALLGAFTVLIPCGTTQAMMALAIGSGSPLLGAAVLFAFVLGTLPVFFILGFFATKLGDSLHQKFMRFAAFAILLLAIFNINNALALTGNSFSLPSSSGLKGASQPIQSAVSEATIEFKSTGYSPNVITVNSGTNIKLHLTNTSGAGCIQSFVIPKLGLSKIVPLGSSGLIEFKAPDTKGQLSFVCGMGMYKGVINVI